MGSPLLTNQIVGLYKQGWSAKQIAEALELNVGAVELMIAGQNKSVAGNKARFGDLKDNALKALEEVMMFQTDFPAARVAAAKVILDEVSKGEEVVFDYDKLASIMGKANQRVIECESSVVEEKEGNTSECRELVLA